MVSIHNNRRPLQRSTHLSSTDEFWLAPIMAMAGDAAQQQQVEDGACCEEGNSSSSSMDVDDNKQRGGSSSSSVASSSLPPAHHQLLIDDESPAFTSLKGYDHTASQDDVVCYSSDSEEDDDDDIDNDTDTCTSRQKVSSVKQQGGGSWLLGFARLNQDDNTAKATAATTAQDEKDEDFTPPGLVRVPSGSSLESEEEDDDRSTSTSSSSSTSSSTKRRRGVSFSPSVSIQPIPHSSSLSPTQRRKMYSTSYEVRLNKIRNKKEYRYDGYDWRNVTEEWEMGVDMVTGELIHPVHEHS